MFILVLQRVLVGAVLDIFYFPLWWYTVGAKHALLWCVGLLAYGNDNFAPGLWLKNIFVPMYGQYDFQGRIISFLMRLAQIIGRSVALAVWLVLCLILFFIWLLIPVVIVWGLTRALSVPKI
ncbi:MAG: hypothetical protein PHD72_00140 [Patescibacteria group bacterium]|nr:hypothetical protein [Patescibacteria group bacterium]